MIRDDLILVVPAKPPILSEYKLPIEVKVIGKLGGHLWEQFELPRVLKSPANPLLLNLASTAPIFTHNQIVTHHDISYIRHSEAFSWSFIVLYRLLVPRFLKSGRAIVTVSEFSKKEISSFWKISPDKISIIPNAVGEMFMPGLPKNNNEPYFLAIGSHAQHKNLATLIDAFLRLQLETKCNLKIIGGEFKSFRRQKYSQNNSRIEFLGRVDDERMIDLLHGARALIFPSLYEGFGIPPLEAQACGTPVIASDIPATREVLGNSAVFFDPKNVDDLVRVISRMDQDAGLRSRLSIAGLENSKRFSWHASARQLSDFIDQMINTQKK
jgi:glycosyltransferase involved in cell wall biosynthesis